LSPKLRKRLLVLALHYKIPETINLKKNKNLFWLTVLGVSVHCPLAADMALGSSDTTVKCSYTLNIKSPPKTHVLKAWSPALHY
jgi:hypothetical protein